MKRFGFFFLSILMGFYFCAIPEIPAQEFGEIEIIFDASRSMNEASGTTTKLDAAKQALSTVANQITAGSRVGLRVFGKNPVQGNIRQVCQDSELVIPIQPYQRETMVSSVLGLRAFGQTPIGYSLELAARDFSASGDVKKTIILISDGEESCGKDPIAVVRELQAQGFNVVVHTIGFAVDQQARGQLQKISELTGGIYADAKDAGELTEQLTMIGEKALLLKPGKRVGQNLLAASAGTRIVYSSSNEFAKLIDGQEVKTDALFDTQEVVFSFKENQAILFEKFAIPIFEQGNYNAGTIHLWGSLESPVPNSSVKMT